MEKIFIFTEPNISAESRQQCRDFALHLCEDNYQAVFIDDAEEAKRLASDKKPVIAVEFPESKNKTPVDYIISNPGELWFEDIEEYYLRSQDKPLFILETKRCYIREFSMEDLDDLFELYSNPKTTAYIEGLFEYDEEKAYQRNYIDLIYKLYGFGMWLVFEKNTDRLIGRAGIEVRQTCKRANQAELGYLIDPKYWHQGYATEVCSAIIETARLRYGIDSFLARCNRENTASQATLRRLGFTNMGHFEDMDDLWQL
ncbi:MAG: GNAT family N-acetyltransferase [Pseudobutyrivibrio sp.]|nr:GNAT family N-acetyltransferase [Pseudobutyrivibrio sp.]